MFHVGAPSPGGAGPVAPAGDGDLPWSLRFGTTALIAFAYGATLVAVGVVWFAGFVARLGDREATAWRVLVRNAAIVGICALLVGLPARAARLGGGIDALDDGEFVAETLRGPIGMSTAVTVAALVALVALVSGRRSGRSVLLSLVGLVALAGFPIEGHTRTTEPRALMIAFDLLHLVAGAVWLGGIAGLIVVFRSRLDPVRVGEIVRRFSTAAVAGVVVVATAGIGMSIIVLPALSDLWSTSYGLALLTKVALVAVVVVLGGYIRRRLVPALDAGAGGVPVRRAGPDRRHRAHRARRARRRCHRDRHPRRSIAVGVRGRLARGRPGRPDDRRAAAHRGRAVECCRHRVGGADAHQHGILRDRPAAPGCGRRPTGPGGGAESGRCASASCNSARWSWRCTSSAPASTTSSATCRSPGRGSSRSPSASASSTRPLRRSRPKWRADLGRYPPGMADDTITPDTKDWTWVLERPCPECGFDASSVDLAGVPELILANAAAWRDVLARSDAARASTARRLVGARVRLPRA